MSPRVWCHPSPGPLDRGCVQTCKPTNRTPHCAPCYNSRNAYNLEATLQKGKQGNEVVVCEAETDRSLSPVSPSSILGAAEGAPRWCAASRGPPGQSQGNQVHKSCSTVSADAAQTQGLVCGMWGLWYVGLQRVPDENEQRNGRLPLRHRSPLALQCVWCRHSAWCLTDFVLCTLGDPCMRTSRPARSHRTRSREHQEARRRPGAKPAAGQAGDARHIIEGRISNVEMAESLTPTVFQLAESLPRYVGFVVCGVATCS